MKNDGWFYYFDEDPSGEMAENFKKLEEVRLETGDDKIFMQDVMEKIHLYPKDLKSVG